jgi:hypothetical protein
MMFAMTWARNPCFVAIIAALTAAPATQAQTPSAAYLAPIARSAAPLIAALDAFRAKTGRCPALAERAEFAALLGRPIEPFSNGALNLTPGEAAPVDLPEDRPAAAALLAFEKARMGPRPCLCDGRERRSLDSGAGRWRP